MKKFGFEGRFECGLDDVIKGKLFAFTPGAWVPGSGEIGLGVAVANEPGYYPVPFFWCVAGSWDEMSAHCDELNEAEGIEKEAAARIICSSMAAGKLT